MRKWHTVTILVIIDIILQAKFTELLFDGLINT